MKFFINYYRAFRLSGGGQSAQEQTRAINLKEMFELIIMGCALAVIFGLNYNSPIGFYYTEFAIYSAAYLSLRLTALTSKSCKYRITDLMPSDYKKRVVGEYVNGVIAFVQMFALLCCIYLLTLIITLLMNAQQTFINLSQNGVTVAFSISLCLWLASCGAITGRIKSFGKRLICDIVVLLVSIGVSVLLYYAAAAVTGTEVISGAAANFGAIPNAALWLVPAYTLSLATLAFSVFVTIHCEKPKEF